MKMKECEKQTMAMIGHDCLSVFSFFKNNNKISIQKFNFESGRPEMGSEKEIELKNYFKIDSKKNIIGFCVTKLFSYLFILLNKQVCCISTKDYGIEYKLDLSVDNIEHVEVHSIENTDNVLLVLDRKKIIYLIFTVNSEDPKIIEKEFNCCFEISVVGDLVSILVKEKSIQIYKLSDEIKLVFERSEDNIKYLKITPDTKYLVIFNEKSNLLKLFRIKLHKKDPIGEVPIESAVRCLNCNNKFIIVGIDDNRILAYLIVDHKNKNHSNRIKHLKVKFVNLFI